jgi:putative endonuclease
VAHRFRVGHTEIDLIARQGDLVTFVEVKTRRGKAFGSPLEAVTGAKRRELVKAARVWVDRFGKPADIYRFDCIAIVDSKLEHLADAFRPGWR